MAGLTRIVASSLAPAAQRFAPTAAAGVLRQVLEVAIDGYQRFPGAERVAERCLEKAGGDPQLAIDGVTDQHIRLAGLQGFLTGIGGLVTLPVALPANLTGLAIVQARMVAAIAHLRGYDLGDPRVRTAVITCLLGEDGVQDRLKKSSLPTSPLAIATAPVFDPELDRLVAAEVVTELMARIGGKRMALTVTRRLPFLGGAVGAGVDSWSTYRVGEYAEESLVRRIRRPIEP
ncbi:EcsC family protein [Kribbella amoyensis]|uniref:EcsC family protein n=1 Tax=Kribbella amoyensis TaxID=996641 RepID=A0A561BPD8_9ACTN|nr:EcsC family protein [Kribbella amoyensis]TWD80729.1 EcsC family protein [Kribbella amoyensis]